MRTRIVIAGAGSASFGPGTLADVLRHDDMAGSELVLVDVDAGALECLWQLACRMNREWGSGLAIERTTDLARALPGAEFVISMVEVNRDALWHLDMTIPHRYGVMQVLGENGGPGGLAHTLRTAPLVVGIARAMESHCPHAWLLNYSNPVPRICRAVTRYTDIRTVGLCHGVGSTLARVAEITGLAEADVDLKVGGLNHFHFVLDARSRRDGSDLYPTLRAWANDEGRKERHLWTDVFRTLGHMPFPSDDHIGEYLPYMHVAAFEPWAKYHHDHWLLHWKGSSDRREEGWARLRRLAAGEDSIEGLRQGTGERGVAVLRAILASQNTHELALNIPNEGAIANLPAGCIVEVPAQVSGFGVRGLALGNLPPAVAALCSIQVQIAELAVQAAVDGDRQAALHALLIDPVVNDIDAAEHILSDYLAAHAPYLPQFAP